MALRGHPEQRWLLALSYVHDRGAVWYLWMLVIDATDYLQFLHIATDNPVALCVSDCLSVLSVFLDSGRILCMVSGGGGGKSCHV